MQLNWKTKKMTHRTVTKIIKITIRNNFRNNHQNEKSKDMINNNNYSKSHSSC
jgi:hypothetical protein